MATNQDLIKGWIQFLKNNQIVSMKSDPETGQLKYKRSATIDDLSKYLESTGKFDDKRIKQAIDTILKKKPPEEQPKQSQEQPKQQVSPEPRKPKPHYKLGIGTGEKPKVTYKGLREALKDEPSPSIDEEDVEKVFDLLGAKEGGQDQQKSQNVEQNKKKELDPAKKSEYLNRLRRLIRDEMTPQQRKTLWRALNEV